MRTAILLSACLFLGACGSVANGSRQDIAITSNPPGADVVVKGRHGLPVFQAITPVVVPLDRGDGYFRPASYMIEVSKDEKTRSVPIAGELSGWYFGNILIGGIVGGLIDPATGGMWVMDRDQVHVDLGIAP